MHYSFGSVIILFLANLIRIYYWLILARVILSWVIRDPENKLFAFLLDITEPVLAPIRKILPSMGLDFSPIIAFFLLRLLSRLLLSFI